MHFALLSAALLLAPLVSAAGLEHAAHQAGANVPRAILHRDQGRRFTQVVKKDKTTKRAAEATLKCTSSYTFSLCDGDNCTDMGSVAAGTKCVNNTIQFDDQPTTTGGRAVPSRPLASGTGIPANMANLPTKSCDESGKESGKIIAIVPTSSSTTSSFSSRHGPSKLHRSTTSSSASSSSTILALAAVATPSSESSSSATTTSTPVATPETTAAPTTSAEPTTTVEAYVATTPVVVQAAVQIVPTTTAASSSSSVITGGYATYFYQEGGTGACGKVHADSDKIVALQIDRYGTGSNNAPDCGKTVSITNTDNGKTTLATVADACPGCKNYNSLDLSTGAFDAIADEASGVIPISWYYVN